MKKHWRSIGIIVVFLLLWRLLLAGMERVAPALWPLREGYLGETSWANFDGVHYLWIAQYGYKHFYEAFFPLYPLLIRFLSTLFHLPVASVAIGVSHASILLGLAIFYRLAKMKKFKGALWAVLLILLYPGSFFFAAVYPTSLFFLLSVATFYAAETKRWWLAGFLGLSASATSLFGIILFPALALIAWRPQLLLIPVGLVAYMAYLFKTAGDALAFYTVQPFFGAERTAEKIVLLPQVLWRYMKILLQVPADSVIYWVSVLELSLLGFALWLLWRGMRRRSFFPYLMYSATVIILPTLTGTLSSFPRYLLSAFPLFLLLGEESVAKKSVLAVIFLASLIIFTSAFLRGHFVS